MAQWESKQVIQIWGWWWGAFTITEVEVNLWSTPRKSGKFNINTTGLTTGKNVNIIQLSWPYTGKWTRSDEAEMDWLIVKWKTTSTTNIECFWNSATKVARNFKFWYIISS